MNHGFYFGWMIAILTVQGIAGASLSGGRGHHVHVGNELMHEFGIVDRNLDLVIGRRSPGFQTGNLDHVAGFSDIDGGVQVGRIGRATVQANFGDGIGSTHLMYSPRFYFESAALRAGNIKIRERHPAPTTAASLRGTLRVEVFANHARPAGLVDNGIQIIAALRTSRRTLQLSRHAVLLPRPAICVVERADQRDNGATRRRDGMIVGRGDCSDWRTVADNTGQNSGSHRSHNGSGDRSPDQEPNEAASIHADQTTTLAAPTGLANRDRNENRGFPPKEKV